MSDGIFSSEEYLSRVLPGWMLLKGREHWKGLARATTRVMDGMLDSIERARAAAMPGQVDASSYAEGGPFPNVDALPIIGRDRGLRRGKHEPAEMYAKRLRMWHEAKRTAGTYPGLLYALRAVLAPTPPRVRLVRGGVPTSPGTAPEGYWWTLDDTGLTYQTWEGLGVHWPADGSAAVPDNREVNPWDWDSQYWDGPPTDPPDPSRLWAIIYAPVNPEITSDDGTYGDGLSFFGEKAPDGDKLTVGTNATAQYVAIVQAVCEDFKAAGCTVSHVLITFDATLFNPDGDMDPGDWPDGWWKHHGKVVDISGTLHRVRARTDKARYWLGTSQRWGAYDPAAGTV